MMVVHSTSKQKQRAMGGEAPGTEGLFNLAYRAAGGGTNAEMLRDAPTPTLISYLHGVLARGRQPPEVSHAPTDAEHAQSQGADRARSPESTFTRERMFTSQ
ncbi:hypothetical protein NDU88_000438 [Pleurodeles waltl]|uniref:Uncharacterized protein n=1 Tax=Pleurodeles waltl TaxID=8319 RepID=A0AAV7UQ04_PLEWA|nr:hypothetical protein NDU88_000438 [Pleurodeles waltl]